MDEIDWRQQSRKFVRKISRFQERKHAIRNGKERKETETLKSIRTMCNNSVCKMNVMKSSVIQMKTKSQC